MSQDIKNVILAGAGGNIGPVVLSALLAEPSFTVSVLSRQESTSTFPDSVKVITTDFSSKSLVLALKGQDAIVSCLANVAIDLQTTLIDAAIDAGVKRFVPAEFGNDTSNAKSVQRVPMYDRKKAVADYCKANENEIAWTGIITGPFFDWGMKVGLFGFALKKKTATLYDPGHDQKFSTTIQSTIGLAVTKALLPKFNGQTKNRYVYVRSLTTTQDEILAALENISGIKWPTETVQLNPLVEEGNEKIGKGDFSGIVHIVLGSLFDPETEMDFDGRGVVDNEMLELPETSLEEELRKVF